MAMNFSELSGIKQWAAVLAGGALVTAALYFTVFKNQSDKNATAHHAVQDKVRENNELEVLPSQAERHGAAAGEFETAAGDRTAHCSGREAGGWLHRDDGQRKPRRRAWSCAAIPPSR